MEPINPPSGGSGPFQDKPDKSGSKKRPGKRRQSGRGPEQVESDNQMPGASGAHPEAPKRRKVESAAFPPPMTSSEDKTVADFVRFCYFDVADCEPVKDGLGYVARFCQLVRMESRNGNKDYVLDVLKITSCSEDLDYSASMLTRLLKETKYDHLEGIEFVRAKMKVRLARARLSPQSESSESSRSSESLRFIESPESSESSGSIEPPEPIEPPDSEPSAVSEPPAVTHSNILRYILRNEETKKVVTEAIRLILGGTETFKAAIEIQKSHSNRWSAHTSLNASLRRWIMPLEPEADGPALGFTADQIRTVQGCYKSR